MKAQKIVQQKAFSLLLILVFSTLSGCFYYKVQRSKSLEKDKLTSFVENKKFLIIHGANGIWHINKLEVKNDSMFARLDTALYAHQKYKTTKHEDGNRYTYSNQEQNVLYEVHLFTDRTLDSSFVTLPLNSIYNVDIYDIDLNSTITTSVFVALGISVLTAGVGLLIIILTKSSCPFIYVSDGHQYKFTGEIFSGAIHKPLERDDYLMLDSIAPDSGKYKIKITNEVKEIQHTNLLELMVIDHNEGEVLMDKYGSIHSFTYSQKAISGLNLKGRDISALIDEEDKKIYPESASKDTDITDGMILQFEIPENIKKASLTIKTKNSFWLDYSFGKFYELFGMYYEKWQNKQDEAPKEELQKWGFEQHIPLSVYVMKQGKWVFADYLNVVGPLAFKKDILSLPIDSITDKPLKVKLEYGKGFWEIDQVRLAIENENTFSTRIISASEAIDEKFNNVKELISSNDSLYLVQPLTTNVSIVKFPVPVQNTARRTVFLHSKGYYRIMRNPKGIPNRKYLESFKEPGSFNTFSNSLLQQVQQSKN